MSTLSAPPACLAISLRHCVIATTGHTTSVVLQASGMPAASRCSCRADVGLARHGDTKVKPGEADAEAAAEAAADEEEEEEDDEEEEEEEEALSGAPTSSSSMPPLSVLPAACGPIRSMTSPLPSPLPLPSSLPSPSPPSTSSSSSPSESLAAAAAEARADAASLAAVVGLEDLPAALAAALRSPAAALRAPAAALRAPASAFLALRTCSLSSLPTLLRHSFSASACSRRVPSLT